MQSLRFNRERITCFYTGKQSFLLDSLIFNLVKCGVPKSIIFPLRTGNIIKSHLRMWKCPISSLKNIDYLHTTKKLEIFSFIFFYKHYKYTLFCIKKIIALIKVNEEIINVIIQEFIFCFLISFCFKSHFTLINYEYLTYL